MAISRLSRFSFLLGLLIISGVTLLLYGPRLNDFFTSDDFDFLAIWVAHDGAFSPVVWFAGAVAYWPGVARPLIGLTGWPLYQLAGTDPFVWHLTSLLLHLIVIWLTAFLIRRFMSSSGAALGAAAVFALHFIHAEPVVWISGRSALLMTALVLGAVLVETAPRSRHWGLGRIIGLALGVCALMAHEAAVVLPLLLLLVQDRPIDVTATGRDTSPAISSHFAGLAKRIAAQWPYWAIVLAFCLSHLMTTAAAFATDNVYRIHLGVNVPKNIAFTAVANLFPLDFRALLGQWNQWLQTSAIDGAVTYLLGHPGTTIGLLAAAIFWVLLFLTGNPAARRLGAWVFVAGIPGFLLPGTGERILYLGSVGGAGMIAAILAGWHTAFVDVFGRRGRMIAPALLVIIVLMHTFWLHDRLRDWAAAARLSRAVVTALDETARDAAPGSVLHLAGLPDNINGAWVFRTSIDDAYRVFGTRRDITVAPYDPSRPDSLSENEALYHWDRGRFVRQVTYRGPE